jgi:hypothetical protein
MLTVSAPLARPACLPRAELNERAEAVSAALTRERLSNTIDTTGTTIGKRWVARPPARPPARTHARPHTCCCHACGLF